jgi:hypothetical protein
MSATILIGLLFAAAVGPSSASAGAGRKQELGRPALSLSRLPHLQRLIGFRRDGLGGGCGLTAAYALLGRFLPRLGAAATKPPRSLGSES